MNNYMPINWRIQKKWTSFQKQIPPKLNQEDIQNLNRPISRSKIEPVIKKKKIPAKECPGPDGLNV